MVLKKLHIVSCCFICSFLACSDFDTAITDRISDEKIWKNPDLIRSVLVNLYDGMELESVFEYWLGWDIYNINITSVSDEGTGAYQAGDLGTMDVPIRTYDDEWFGCWKNTYEKIRACNVFLEKIPNARVLESDLISAYIAEVRFIRAYHYFTLAKRYGGVPIITVVQNLNSENLQLVRDTEKTVWDFIIQELLAAKQDLPENRDSANKIRITKQGAWALMSRAALYAASVAQYGNAPELQLGGEAESNEIVGINSSEASRYWQIASDAANAVIESDKYHLYKKYEDKIQNYRQLFLDKSNGEYIFWKEYLAPDKSHGFDMLNVPFSFVGGKGYGCGINPTLDLIQAYEYKDGSPGLLKTQNELLYIQYDSPLELFKDKDPRLEATFYLPMDSCRGGIVEIRRGVYDDTKGGKFVYYGNIDAIYGDKNDATQIKLLGKDGIWDTGDVGKTGFYTKKFADESMKNLDYSHSDTQWPVFRLAEMYLNRAEAEWELGSNQNKLNALAALNEIRNRAGIRELTSDELTLDKIRNERRIELAYEGHRFWDMRRWRIAHVILNNFETMALYPWLVWSDWLATSAENRLNKGPATGKYIFTIGRAPKCGKLFLKRHYYIRISDSDMSSNPKLIQNPGY